jgi:hypothetical protein
VGIGRVNLDNAPRAPRCKAAGKEKPRTRGSNSDVQTVRTIYVRAPWWPNSDRCAASTPLSKMSPDWGSCLAYKCYGEVR